MKSPLRALPLLAALALSSALAFAAPPTTQRPGEYFDDAVITTKVKTAILEEPSLKSMEITVETFKGVVQLSGFVRSQANIDVAVLAAKNVEGVSEVKNDMRLK